MKNQTYVLLFFVIGQTNSSVEEELQYNKRLTKTREEFIKIMNELNLPYPKQIGKLCSGLETVVA